LALILRGIKIEKKLDVLIEIKFKNLSNQHCQVNLNQALNQFKWEELVIFILISLFIMLLERLDLNKQAVLTILYVQKIKN
jgi:hypothetical protein